MYIHSNKVIYTLPYLTRTITLWFMNWYWFTWAQVRTPDLFESTEILSLISWYVCRKSCSAIDFFRPPEKEQMTCQCYLLQFFCVNFVSKKYCYLFAQKKRKNWKFQLKIGYQFVLCIGKTFCMVKHKHAVNISVVLNID